MTLNKGEILDKDTLKKSIVIEKSASNSEIFNLVYNLERTENWDNFIKFVYEPSKKYNYEKNQKINIEYFPSIIRNTDEKSVVFRYLNTLFQQGKNCNKLLDKSKVGEVVFRVSISCVWIKDVYHSQFSKKLNFLRFMSFIAYHGVIFKISAKWIKEV